MASVVLALQIDAQKLKYVIRTSVTQVLLQVFLVRGNTEQCYMQVGYKILVFQSMDLSATGPMVAKSNIAEALPETYWKTCSH